MILLSILPFVTAARPQEGNRLPVPEAGAQKQAEALVRDIFKEDYRKTSPGDKIALARKLLSQAGETRDDPSVRYVLLRETRDLAAAAGETELALLAATEMIRAFNVNALEMKVQVLSSLQSRASQTEQCRILAERYLDLLREAFQADEYEIVDRAGRAAQSLAQRSKDVPLVARVTSEVKGAEARKSRFEKVVRARESLAADPDSPEANFTVGAYCCFVKGDWERGLPFLAKGSDATSKALAEADLAAPNGVSEQTALGDGWWDRAQKEKGVERENLVLRAAVWYERTFRGAQGLTRAKIEQRLSEAEGIRLAREGWIDVTNPSIFGLPPTPDRLIRVTVGEGFRPVELKNPPPGKYDGFSAQVRIVGKGQVKFYLDDKAHEIFLQNGSFWSYSIEGPTQKKENFFIRGPKREVYRVRMILADGNYVVSLDGQESGKIKTKADRLEKFSMAFNESEFTLSDVRLHKKQ